MRKEMKDQISLFLTLLATFTLIFLFYPVYIASHDGVYYNTQTLLTLFASVTVVAYVISLLSFLMKGKEGWLRIPVSALLLFVFVKGSIFPGRNIGVLDGSQNLREGGDWTIWLSLFGGYVLCLAICWFYRKSILVLMPVGLLVFSLIYIAVIMMEQPSFRQRYAKKVHPFSDTNVNVIVLCLDMLQGSIIERMSLQEPEVFKEFNGFTFFTKSISSFPYTIHSKPVITTGGIPSTNTYVEAEIDLANASKDTFIHDFLERGFSVTDIGMVAIKRIFPELEHHPAVAEGRFFHYASLDYADFADFDVYLMNNHYLASVHAGIGRIIGFWWKWASLPKVINDLGVIEKKINAAVLDILPSLIQVERNASGTLLAHWNYSTHGPVAFARSGELLDELPLWPVKAQDVQDEFSNILTKVNTLLSALKKKGVYNNSLIIILGDHGHGCGVYSEFAESMSGFEHISKRIGNYRHLAYYNPAVLIKPPYVEDSAKVQCSEIPIWLGDIRDILNYYINSKSYANPAKIAEEIAAVRPIPEILYRPFTTGNISPWDLSRRHFVQASTIEQIHDRFIDKFNEISDWAECKGNKDIFPITTSCLRGWAVWDNPARVIALENEPGILKLRLADYSPDKKYQVKIKVEYIELSPEISLPEQSVSLTVNGIPVLQEYIVRGKVQDIVVDLPHEVMSQGGYLYLEFSAAQALILPHFNKASEKPDPWAFTLRSLVIQEVFL